MVPSPLRTLREVLTDDVWRFALVAGGLAAGSIVADAWPSVEMLDFGPVFVAGALGGYHFHPRRATRKRVGARIGLVGALPAVWQAVVGFEYILGLVQPSWVTLLQTVLLVGYIALGVCFVTMIGIVGAAVGEWVSARLGRSKPTPAGH
jgi:hypothetical protein